MADSQSSEQVCCSQDVEVVVEKSSPVESETNRSRFWRILCVLFLLGTLFQSFKPSTPYVMPYLKYRHNMDGTQVSNQYYPYRTFSLCILMIPITILAEFYVGYKPVLFAGIAARVSEQFMLYYGASMDFHTLRMSQILHGLASCTKTVHGAILYLIAPHEFFPVMTGLLRSSNLVGQIFEGVTGNLVYSALGSREQEYFTLFTITQVTVTTGGVLMLILFILLSYDKKCANNKDSSRPLAPKITSYGMLRDLLTKIYLQSPGVLLWSFWWWTAASVGEVVDEMHTSLIDERLHTGADNGYLSATIGACSALCAFLTGRSKYFVKRNSVSIVLGCLAICGTLIFIATHATSAYVLYPCIVIVLFLSEGSAVAANSIISVALPKSCRGLALFTNSFLQYLFQSLIQFFPQVFGWSASTKFKILGGILYAVFLVILFGTRRTKQIKECDSDAGDGNSDNRHCLNAEAISATPSGALPASGA